MKNGDPKVDDATQAKTQEIRREGRWMLVMADGKTPQVLAGRHVLIEGKLETYARVLAARWLVSKGVPLDEADGVKIVAWKANGWHPQRVILVAGGTAQPITETIIDIEVK